MAAVVLGGASAPGSAAPAAEVQAQSSLDLNFVTEAVQGGLWALWGEKFAGLDDLIARITRRVPGGGRIGRLAIAAYSADHTSGFVSFDIGFGNRERIDGLNMNPIRPEVAAKLALLRPFLDPDGVVEFRVCGMGQGAHGLRALQAAADVLGVATRGPVDKSIALAPHHGLVTEWITVFPSVSGRPPVRSNWLEKGADGVRVVDPVYIPVPGVAPGALPAPRRGHPGDLHFATKPAAAWMQGVPAISGVRELVDSTIAALGPDRRLQRLAITTNSSAPYDGFVAFDAGESESIDGSIREQPGYAHLQVMVGQVREQLERLRPHLAPDAVIEFRSAGFGLGESGLRALGVLADLLGTEVRVSLCGAADLRESAGLVTRWLSVFPAASGREPVESSWQEVSEPAPEAAWVAPDPAAYAPIRGLNAPLPVPSAPAAEPAVRMAATEVVASASPAELVVVCAGCGRALDEPWGTPLRARTPCPGCGSQARRQEKSRPRVQRQGPLRRLFG